MNRLLLAAAIGMTLSACSGTPGNTTTGGDEGEPERRDTSSSGSTASTGATSSANGGTSTAVSSESQGATSAVITTSSGAQNSSQAQSGGNSTGSSSENPASSQGASGATSAATSSMTTASSGATTPQPVGGPCAAPTDCADGLCITALPGGYCTRADCAAAGCPTGSTCFNLGDNLSACFKDCTAASECRVNEGYTCDADNSCYAAPSSPDGGVVVTTGAVGSACTASTQCTDGTCITSLPGGYCTRSSCMAAGCPTGSTCFDVGNNQSACFADCTTASECRVNEGYTCDADNTCFLAPPSPDGGVVGMGAVGAACTSPADCTDGACLNTLPGGYCTRNNCMTAGCPTGSTCFGLSAGGSACFRDCASAAECRTTEGYTCDADNTCYPGAAPMPCSPQNPSGTCSGTLVCINGACQQFMCTDTRFEPNESQSAAAVAPLGTTTGLALCSADRDWFEMPVPPATIGRLGVTFNNAAGDLDLSAYTAAGACMGGRVEHSCNWTYRGYETGEEYLSVLNGATTQREWAWQLMGYGGAANTYSLTREDIPWSDGATCTPTYPVDECEGRPNGSLRLIQFPFADPQDPYVGDGYRFDSDTNYRWLRRELIMLVRHAIHETQLRFGGTLPLGLIDMCQRDGITPGYDINDPRHPETTHDQGGNIDIAYYTTLAGNPLAYNEARIICGPTENSNNDGAFCTAAAATQHVVDLPRQVYFMTKIMDHPRLRVVGADQVIAPLLVAEAQRQFGLGWMTQTQRNRWNTRLAYGEGWPYHHHHIHVSMNFWDSGKPGTGPRDGCGLETLQSRPLRDARPAR